MIDALGPFYPLGVVPVFVNAGAALLPALVAGAASFFALLFRPRMLWAACRRNPRAAAIGLMTLLVLAAGGTWLMRAGAAPKPASPAAVEAGQRPPIDWTARARQWIREGKTRPVAADPSSNQTTTMFGGGPNRSGCLGGDGPLGLVEAWQFPAGSPLAEPLANAYFLSSPAVCGDAIFAASCLNDFTGNYGTLVCLSAAPGKLRWFAKDYQAGGETRNCKGFFSSPAVTADGKYLVIGQGLHDDSECDLLCFDARTGRLHWRVPTPLHLESSPAIENDLVVVGAGSIEQGDDRRVDGHPGLVLAIEVSTGKKRWEFQLPDPESSPLLYEGVAYIGSGFNGNAVVALRTETDEQLRAEGKDRLMWRAATPHPATGPVTLAGDLVLVGCGNSDFVYGAKDPQGAVIAIDRRSGKTRWTVPLPDSVLGKIAVRGNLAVVPVRNGEVVALDLAADSPRIVWRQKINGGKAVLSGPALTESRVYAVSQDGRLAVLNASDGRVLESRQLNDPARPGDQGLSFSSPLIVNGRLYVGSETGGLRCFAGK